MEMAEAVMEKITQPNLPENNWIASVIEILKQGNVAEVKREKDNVVVIEIKRTVRNKTAING